MSLLDSFMPHWRLRQVEHVAVTADPDRAYQVARAVDMFRVPIARLLFGMRLLPDRAAAWLHGKDQPASPTLRIDDITRPGSGFRRLADGDREVVVGAIGRFWQPRIEFADVPAEAFASHDDRSWGKLAWSLAVVPRDGGAWITFDLRVDAGDEASWARFQRYWHLIGPFSHLMRRWLLRSIASELGAAPPDDARPLVGDEVLPEARAQLTHAIDIEAPPAAVWPWLVQMGCQRAGWYSWDRLDNAGVPSADKIIPELQHLAVGDVLPARPTGPDGFEVLKVIPERALVLGSTTSLFDGSWTFELEPIGDAATHLITRYRAAYTPGPRMALALPVITPVHAFMEHKQLRTLKARAEATARPA